MAPRKIIIDTDPGVDDVLAILLALSALPEELEVIMLSATYGNVPRESCLKNIISTFKVLEKELAWRAENGLPQRYEALKACPPIVAVGPEHPLEEEELEADYFHGMDGLHGAHEALPELSPPSDWKECFDVAASNEGQHQSGLYRPTSTPSHLEILRLLREHPADSITLLTVGPMTTAALAAATDPETFLKLREVVVMGGAVNVPGNITPKAEFNTYADSIATARVFALSSAKPNSTMPSVPSTLAKLPNYPDALWRKLRIALFPLDITTPHLLLREQFDESVKELLAKGSPLAKWVSHFMSKTFDHILTLISPGESPGLSLHDPLTVWYVLTHGVGWATTPKPEDIRVETVGQWTRGMHMVDNRGRKRADEITITPATATTPAVTGDEVPGDDDGWLSAVRGNRIHRYVTSPGEDIFAPFMLNRIFH